MNSGNSARALAADSIFSQDAAFLKEITPAWFCQLSIASNGYSHL